MSTTAAKTDERVGGVDFSATELIVTLMDGRTISVPLSWYPRLASADQQQLSNWHICGGGYGLHWPDLDEDLSTEGLLKGIPARN